MLIDTHCHLYYDSIKKDIQRVLARAKEQGVNRFICVGTNLDDSKECQILSEQHENVFFSAGIHPHDSKNVSKKYLQHLRNFIQYDKMVAVGEMGLDYFRNFSPKDSQVKVFREQLELAQQVNKPVIFHNRDADKDVIKILSEFPGVTGVAHCFSSDLETAKVFLDMGIYISFSGNLTFKNSHLSDVVKEIPLDKVLVETDSPYLAPLPYRGKFNEPSYIVHTIDKLSQIKRIPKKDVMNYTTNNFKKLFNLS